MPSPSISLLFPHSLIRQFSWFVRARRKSVALIFAVGLLLAGLIGWELRTSYLEAETAGRLAAQNLSLLLKEQLGAAFGETDLVLRDLVGKVDRNKLARLDSLGESERRAMTALLAEKQSTLPQVDSLALVSPDGSFALTPEAYRPTHADQRRYFEQLVSNPGQTVVISPPLPTHFGSDMAFVIMRRIPGEQDKPAGAVAAVVRLEFFNQLARRLEMGGDDTFTSAFTLVDNNLLVVGRYPELPELIGQPVPNGAFLSQWVNGRENGYAVFRSVIDGVTRCFSFNRLEDFPFIVIVGVPEAAYLQNWRLKALAYVVGGCLLLLFMLSIAWRGWRESQMALAIRAGELRLQEQSVHIERIIHTIGRPLLLLRTADLTILVANTAAAALCGEAVEALVGRKFTTLLRDAATEVDMVARLSTVPTFDECELQFLLANGETPWVSISGSRLEFRNEPAYFVSVTDISERKQAQETLWRKATLDPLTGIPNRGYFTERAQSEWLRATRYGHHIGLLMLDLDHFKAINDGYGHPAGDAVLRSITERIRRELRETDLFGRLGGEEFAILMPEEASEADMLQAAERLRHAIAASPIRLPNGEEIRATVSIGCVLSQASTPDLDLLLRQADQALYSAKRSGRNRVVNYHPAKESPP